MSKFNFLVAVMLGFSLLSCEKEEANAPVTRPTSLVVDIEVSNTEEGLVNVSASAFDANYYRVEFFHNNGSTVVESQDGEASYKFTESGTYAISTRAYASFEYFISKTDSVSVSVTVDTNTAGIPTTGYSTPLSYPGYNLVWNDEFDGTSLSSDWTHEIGTGNGGWGNNELQYYREENTELKDGLLLITAKAEPFGNKNYTSSRIITQGKQSFKYGRIDIRAALPYGQGIWPALWMLGSNFDTVGWPKCGEIDIMEMVGGQSRANGGDDKVFGTVHWDSGGQRAEFGGSNQLSSGKFADEFHVFSIIWDSQKITWYRDDIKFHEVDITPADLDEFQKKFFFIFNVAVGGNWPGSPNASTQFPQTMAVDYVRVFQK